MIRCDLCTRGILHQGDWGNPCLFCGGRGEFSLEFLCESIGEHVSTVRKVLKPRAKMRAKVAARICGKIVELLNETRTAP
jgi:hypothetical protein